MAGVGSVPITWANGEDNFCLARVREILQLEDKCGAGMGEIVQRLERGTWFLNDIRETIRLGLIGGGKTPEQAMKIVRLCVDGRPLSESILVARLILTAALVGVPDDPVGKMEAAEAATGPEAMDQASSIPTAASAAPPSSESDKPSDGPSMTPTTPPSGSSPPASMGTTARTPPSPSPSP